LPIRLFEVVAKSGHADNRQDLVDPVQRRLGQSRDGASSFCPWKRSSLIPNQNHRAGTGHRGIGAGWYERRDAKQSTYVSMIVWTVLLIVLLGAITQFRHS